MARTKWDDLLPSSATSSLSRNDMVQQLARATSPGSSAVNLNSASGSSAPAVVSGQVQGSAGDFTEQILSLTAQMSSLASIQQTQVSVTQDNTQAITQNTTSKSSGGSSVGSTVGGVASTLLGGGSILSPIVSGLMSLFGSGDSGQTTTATSPFMLPAPAQYEGGVTGGTAGQVVPVSYGESGQPRAQATSPASQVTIQVNAMDSQSFLDHSDDIATAVKAALLSSHSLSDVISDM